MEMTNYLFTKHSDGRCELVQIKQPTQKACAKMGHPKTILAIMACILAVSLFIMSVAQLTAVEANAFGFKVPELNPSYLEITLEESLVPEVIFLQEAPVEELTPPVTYTSLEIPTADGSNTGVKTWMDYRAITNKKSMQWALQQNATTDPTTGIRMCDGAYMVALGTYYAKNAGERFHIALENGFEFDAITGDIKSIKDTDPLGQHRNGNIVEFVVDSKAIPRMARLMGDMSYASAEFSGKIAAINKIG